MDIESKSNRETVVEIKENFNLDFNNKDFNIKDNSQEEPFNPPTTSPQFLSPKGINKNQSILSRMLSPIISPISNLFIKTSLTTIEKLEDSKILSKTRFRSTKF